MRTRTKIWLGLGVAVLAGTAPSTDTVLAGAADTEVTPAPTSASASAILVAQHRHGGEQGGEGEGGEGEGGESGAAALPPDLGFAVNLGLVRGHLLVGDELVKQGQWSAALVHFLHPGEEIYGDLRPHLKAYDTPPFEAALKRLANLVKRKQSGEEYESAKRAVLDALAAGEQGVRSKQQDWPAFAVETALELLKVAADEYDAAITGNRFTKPVEYQDSRGFVLHAEAMIDAVGPDLERKDPEALKKLREALAQLKTAWPAAMPPKTPVKDSGAVLADVSRAELAAGPLM